MVQRVSLLRETTPSQITLASKWDSYMTSKISNCTMLAKPFLDLFQFNIYFKSSAFFKASPLSLLN